jgi:SAM-dependent methyltransferase
VDACAIIHDVCMDSRARDVASMPRGGPNASWLDRRLQTDRLEYLDRDDVDDLKQKVLRTLERGAGRRWIGAYARITRIVLDEVADVPCPKILELGAGLGGLSRKLLENHPAARVTVTDIDPTFVADIAAGDLGSHPRATVRTMDATAIDAPDGYYDLAVFSLSLHHLRPAMAARVFAEGTRVASKLLIIDLRRPPAPLHLLVLATVFPLTRLVPLIHDGFISSLRAYSPSALSALAEHADPGISVDFRTLRVGPTVVVARHAN